VCDFTTRTNLANWGLAAIVKLTRYRRNQICESEGLCQDLRCSCNLLSQFIFEEENGKINMHLISNVLISDFLLKISLVSFLLNGLSF